MDCLSSFSSIHHSCVDVTCERSHSCRQRYRHSPLAMLSEMLRAVTFSSWCFTASAAVGGFCFSYHGDIWVPLSMRPNGQVLAGFGHWELIKVQRLCPVLIHQQNSQHHSRRGHMGFPSAFHSQLWGVGEVWSQIASLDHHSCSCLA